MESQNTNPQNLKRTFIIGDEWIFYKFYTGPKTADVLLTEMIKPAVEKLLAEGMIDKWFFIRYSDPKFHIRVRFHVTELRFLLNVVLMMQSMVRPFIDQDLVWKVQVDSYQREVERYGVATMELGETLFFHDSKMIVDMLDMLDGDEGEKYRWLFCIRALDTLLDDFHYDMQSKMDLFAMLKDSFGREFGINKGLRNQLKNKYRSEKPIIYEVLNRSKDQENEMLPLYEILVQKSEAIKPLVAQLMELHKKEQLVPALNDMMSSYIHMMLNRLFKSKQRVHELVVYDFMWNYYKGEVARQKYSKKKK